MIICLKAKRSCVLIIQSLNLKIVCEIVLKRGRVLWPLKFNNLLTSWNTSNKLDSANYGLMSDFLKSNQYHWSKWLYMIETMLHFKSWRRKIGIKLLLMHLERQHPQWIWAHDRLSIFLLIIISRSIWKITWKAFSLDKKMFFSQK